MTSHDIIIKKKLIQIHSKIHSTCHNFLNKSSLMVKNPASVIGPKYLKDVME